MGDRRGSAFVTEEGLDIFRFKVEFVRGRLIAIVVQRQKGV